MPVSVEEVRAFIADAKRGSRANWLSWAERSWAEIKKRTTSNRLLSISPNTTKKRVRYPVWHSIFKIRQPLLLSRAGIPICKDTTQDGIDNVGASAAFFKERLAINLAKTSPFLDVIGAGRDDFLATCIGQLRAYYERDEIKERVKKYLTPQQIPDTEEVVFLDDNGNTVESDDIGQDDEGFFIETDQLVDVKDERVCLKPVLYRSWGVDSDVTRWEDVERLYFELSFSVPRFKEVYGAKAYAKLPKKDDDDDATPKKQSIVVYEYWDRYERKVYWLPENGPEFVTPLRDTQPHEYEEGEQPNGLYDLDNFFPCPPPLVVNQATDEFWPVPEYYQLIEILEDIHTLFSRMLSLTKAIRPRLLFDNSIEGLQAGLSEATEAEAFGITNLANALVSAGGTLDSVCQYIPVEKMIAALQQIYVAFEQRLNSLYRLTGVSDLLQGFTSDTADKTFGERQMLEKYALNQHAEPQRKMQEFVRNCYELLCEMAIKNFKDESLERYMMPKTAPPTHQRNFKAALGLLRDDKKRFRIDLETDSTIALNEQYDKAMRIELVNALTASVEKVASIAQSAPELVAIELHALKFLIQGFRQGKMFQEEITQSIDNVVKKLEAAAAHPSPPDIDQMKMQLEQAKLQAEAMRTQSDLKLREYEILSRERLETAKLQQQQQLDGIRYQLDQYKLQSEAVEKSADRNLQFEKLRNEIALAQAKLQQDGERLMLEAQQITDESTRKSYELQLKERIAMGDQQLKAAAQELNSYSHNLDIQERWATEQRLQSQGQLEQAYRMAEIEQKRAETQHQSVLAMAKAGAMGPVTTPKRRETVRVKQGATGAPEYEIETEDGIDVA